jgi:hypothetical protein
MDLEEKVRELDGRETKRRRGKRRRNRAVEKHNISRILRC